MAVRLTVYSRLIVLRDGAVGLPPWNCGPRRDRGSLKVTDQSLGWNITFLDERVYGSPTTRFVSATSLTTAV